MIYLLLLRITAVKRITAGIAVLSRVCPVVHYAVRSHSRMDYGKFDRSVN